MPIRYQLHRARGYRKPVGAINVARPTKWGNPFNWQEFNATNSAKMRRMAVEYYKKWLDGEIDMYHDERDEILESLDELRGKNLACWCPLDESCHADILIELANNAAPNKQINRTLNAARFLT